MVKKGTLLTHCDNCLNKLDTKNRIFTRKYEKSLISEHNSFCNYNCEIEFRLKKKQITISQKIEELVHEKN